MLRTDHDPFHRFLVAALLTLGLVACGGGGSSPSGTQRTAGIDRTGDEGVVFEEAPTSSTSTAAGQTAPTPRQPSGVGAITKAAAQRIPVYRLYNSTTGAHFYTTSETEKNTVLASQPQYSLDGVAFHAINAFAPGLSPVYRFYNTFTGVHFYTISETEKANILATLPHFQLDGVSYHASPTAGQGFQPLYRFFVPARGFHFYTASATEKNSIIATLAGTYTYEGIAYYVADTNWNSEKLPHTGLSVTQCYAINPFTSLAFFGSCESAVALSGQQDSKRRTINPMQYGSVYYFLGSFLASYAKTSCVYDTVTGLTWEGKPDDGGFRDKDNRYTNLGGGGSTDTSGYIAAVNASNLCGYNDWRLPTALELNSLLNYGDTSTTTPHLDATWFPNSALSMFWTSHIASPTQAVTAFSFHGSTGFYTRDNTMPVRLVRGTPNTASPRFTYSTIYFNSPVVGADAANNVVNDALTGLQWRRCHYGERWTGSACSGGVNIYTHASALTAADGLGGWRLPNAKEAASLLELNRITPPFINSTAFPASSESVSWTSTAYTSDAMNKAFILSTNGGTIGTVDRSEFHGMRLVRVP